jgi:hypothetical protein
MAEMLREMWPGMTGARPGTDPPPAVWAAFWKKVEPGMQLGEHPGSLHEALMAAHPAMRMDPASMKPGVTSEAMVRAMLDGWRRKHGGMPPAPPLDMTVEP